MRKILVPRRFCPPNKESYYLFGPRGGGKTTGFIELYPNGFLDQSPAIEKGALEGLLGEHLPSWIDEQIEEYDFSFWRTCSGLEVDFIAYGPESFAAIEIKNNTKINPADLKGLQAFHQDYSEANRLFLYRGKDRVKKGEILCLPVDEFLKELDTHL